MKNKKIISFICCSRRRRTLLEQSALSIFTLAKYPENIELLIRFDNDDIKSIKKFPRTQVYKNFDIKIKVGERYGYKFLVKYYNELIQIANGDILSLWGDDLIMIKKDWDIPWYDYVGKIAVFTSIPTFTRKTFNKYIKKFVHGPSQDTRIRGMAIINNIWHNDAGVKKCWKHLRENDDTHREGRGGQWQWKPPA